MRNPIKKKGSRAKFIHKRLESPKRFDPRSFRTIRSDSHRVTIGCPKGQWDAGRKRCRVGTRAQSVLHPKGELPIRTPRRSRMNATAGWAKRRQDASLLARTYQREGYMTSIVPSYHPRKGEGWEVLYWERQYVGVNPVGRDIRKAQERVSLLIKRADRALERMRLDLARDAVKEADSLLEEIRSQIGMTAMGKLGAGKYRKLQSSVSRLKWELSMWGPFERYPKRGTWIPGENPRRRAYNPGNDPKPGEDPVWDLITTGKESNPGTFKGKVSDIQDHGTIVSVTVAGKLVYFDRRMFENMWEAEEGDVLGRRVKVSGTVGEQRVEFLSNPKPRKRKRSRKNHCNENPDIKAKLRDMAKSYRQGKVRWRAMQKKAKDAVRRWAKKHKIESNRKVRKIIGSKTLRSVGLRMG